MGSSLGVEHNVLINHRLEYLIIVRGTFLKGEVGITISSLMFETNRMRYGQYGYASGASFHLMTMVFLLLVFWLLRHPNYGTRVSGVGFVVRALSLDRSLKFFILSTNRRYIIHKKILHHKLLNCLSAETYVNNVVFQTSRPLGASMGHHSNIGVFVNIRSIQVRIQE